MKKRMIIVSMLLVLLFSVSSVMAADINLVSPTGGEFLNVESVDIVWTLISGAGTDAVIVEYSDNSGAPLSWNILTSSASAQDLTYPWNTSTIADGCSYRIRLSSTDNSPDEITEDMCLDKLAPVPALDDETIDEGDGVTFDASASTDATAGIQYYMWDIDNDGTEDFSTTVSSLTLTWAQLVSFGIDNNGAFTIGLRVIDYATNDASTTATLTVDNVVPTVTVVSPNGGEELTGTVPVQYTITDPVDVTFTCTFTQTVGGVSTVLGSAACVPGTNTYSWDASTIDSDDVTFTVDADDGDDVGTDTSDAAFLVDNTNPVADADVDQTVDESDVVTYAFGATDGVVGSQFDDQADSFTVNFGDGTALLVTDSLAGITHVYADDGVYTVRLTVTDDVGLTHFDEMDVTVNNVDPVVDAGSDDETNEGTAISLASTFTDVGTADTHTATIDWGDLGVLESVNPATSPITNTHTYVDNGVYIVTVTVTDDDGGFSSDTLTVTVNNVAPTVELLVPPEGDNVNGNVNVTWVISDPSNDTIYNILRYSGDSGATWTTLTSGYHDYVTANGQQHTYMWDTTAVPDGLYNLRVVAQDNDLAENSHNINLTVDNTAPTTQSVESTPADEFASGTEVLFMATLSDNFGVYGGVFKVWDNGVEVLSDATVLPADGVWGDTTEEVLIRLSISLDEDVYQWSIVGTDLAGNTKTFVPGVDVADNFKVTAADASVPDFTLDASQTGAGVSGSILYTVTSITEPLSYVEFEIMPTGEARIFLERVTTLNGDGDYLYTLDTTEYVDGSYRVYATAYDLAGNPKERYKSITVDNAEYYTVEVIDEMITNLNASINANTLLVAGLQTQVDTLSQNVSDNSDAVGVIQTEIVALQLQSSNNAGDIVTLQGLVDVLRTDVDANVADIAALDARLTTLETTSGTMQTDLTALETKLNAFLAFTVMDTTAELFEYPNTVTVTGTTSEVATCTAYDQYGNSLGSMTTADGLAHSFVVTSPEAGTTPFELRCATADYTKSAYSAYDYLMYYAINEPDTERGFGYVGATRNPYPFWMSTNALNAANLTNVTVENVLLGGLSTLESDDVDVLWSYNPSTDSWDSYKPGNVANTFTDFTATLGYYELEYLATGFGKYIRHTKVN